MEKELEKDTKHEEIGNIEDGLKEDNGIQGNRELEWNCVCV